MRRSVGLVLVGLGVLMLVLAPLSRWYAYPQLAVVPNEVAERVSTGADITVLDLGAVVRQEPEVERVTDVRSVRRIIPDQGESGGDTAVWDTSVTTFDELGAGATPEENVLSYFEERVAFDRHTSEAVDGHDQYYTPTGERADRVEVDHAGYYFKLPFGVEQRTYPFWDSTIQDTRPLEFQSETTLEGLPVYVFQQVIEPTPVSALEIPGALFGQPGSIVADRVYSNTRTLWVEPHTGAIIKGQEEQDSYLDFEGTRGPTIVQGTLASTGDQVTANVDEYASSAERLELVRETVPVAAAAAGVVLVILGLVLARRGPYPGKRRAPLPEDDGVSGGPIGAAGVGSAAAVRDVGVVAGTTVMSRTAEERAPLQRPQTRSPEPVRSYRPADQQYGSHRPVEPVAGSNRDDDASAAPAEQPYTRPAGHDDAGSPADQPYARPAGSEPAAGVAGDTDRSGAAPASYDDPVSGQYAQAAGGSAQGAAAASGPAEQSFAERSATQFRTRAERIAAATAAAAPAHDRATEQAGERTPPAEQPLPEQPPPAERQPLPRRPQASAVRPPVGRPHVQPGADQTQRDAALERTRADLDRLERARAELARFAEEHPDLTGADARTDAAEPAPPASEAGAEPPAAEPRPAAPSQSGRRRARDDDGLFDEFDEDGQSAGSLHRY
ncbi:porin PorA family protein [Jiangella ureilytica]|nr:porin PorA family protein [Jiangella ureilytica]